MIQKATFTDGGFVLHKIKGNFNGKASAWFDAQGVLLDAEQITIGGVSRPVKRDGKIWHFISSVGRAWKN